MGFLDKLLGRGKKVASEGLEAGKDLAGSAREKVDELRHHDESQPHTHDEGEPHTHDEPAGTPPA